MPHPNPIPGRRLIAVILWAFLLGGAGTAMPDAPARAADAPVVEKAPAPDWVQLYDPAAPGNVPHDEIQDGRYYLQVDRQIRVADGAPTAYYNHYAVYLDNESSLEVSSQLNIGFDPSYQKLVLNRLRVIRDGEARSRLAGAAIQLLRREKRLESLMYDGRYTANIIIDDVRVGDIIDYAYTLIGDNPIYGGIFSDWLAVEWRVPIKRVDYVVHWPPDRPFHQVSHNTALSLAARQTPEELVYSLSAEHIQSRRQNSETPSWHRPYGSIQISQIGRWSEVVAWALPLYAGAYRKNPAVTDLARTLGAGLDNDEQRVMAVLGYMQSQVRYLGIEIGVNSHQPSPPEQTLARRYGDCKDKTVAMIALLEALGITARPVLVQTDIIRLPEDFHPAIDAFDHVIVKVDLPGRTYWLDPTRGFQGRNLNRVFQPDYGYCLVIAPGQDGLTLMPENTRLVGYRSEEYFELPRDRRAPVTYTVMSVHSGLDAELQRRRIAEEGIQELQNRYLDYYRKFYPGIRSASPLDVEDDEHNNILRITEFYTIADFWEKDDDDNQWSVAFLANTVEAYLKQPKQRIRSDPYWIGHPENIEQSIHVLLPKPWDIDAFEFHENNDYFHFLAKAAYDENTTSLHLTYRYRSMRGSVPPDAMPDFIRAVDRARDNLDYYLYQPAGTDVEPAPAEGPAWPRIAALAGCGLLALGLIYALVEWIMDSRRLQLNSPVAYYPVSLLKFSVLNMVTLGIYQIYWAYKQWSYIRTRDDSHVMPMFRAIFSPLWFYALFKDLRADSMRRYGRSLLPAAPWAALLMAAYIGSDLAQALGDLGVWLAAIDFLCLLPLANYVRFINRDEAAAMAANSRFRPRHAILAVAASLLLVYGLGTGMHWLPTDEVISGSQLPAGSIRFMQHQGLVQDDVDLIYFYSDGVFSNREDGNGVTRNLVFSYWRDEESGRLVVRHAAYEDIDSIRVSKGGDTAVITIIPKSGSDFLLYASRTNGMHQKMIQEIKDRIAKHLRPPADGKHPGSQ